MSNNSLTTAPKNATAEGKPSISLIPMDILVDFLLPAYEEGVTKYEKESWRQGFLVSDMVDAAMRHMNAFYYDAEDIDPDSKTNKHHLGGAIFSLLSICHTLKYRPELDNRRRPDNGYKINAEQEKAA